MEPDDTDFDRLIAWLESLARSEKGHGDIVVRIPAPVGQTAQIIPFLPRALRRQL